MKKEEAKKKMIIHLEELVANIRRKDTIQYICISPKSLVLVCTAPTSLTQIIHLNLYQMTYTSSARRISALTV